MKYLKKYQKFFEDGEGGGCATVNASTTAGMGAVVSAQVGPLPGVPGTSGSGDIGFGLGSGEPIKRKRKKGKPSQVSDLRDLKDEETNSVDESNQFDLATEALELYHLLCEDGVDRDQLDREVEQITGGEGWYSLDDETLNQLVDLLKNYNK